MLKDLIEIAKELKTIAVSLAAYSAASAAWVWDWFMMLSDPSLEKMTKIFTLLGVAVLLGVNVLTFMIKLRALRQLKVITPEADFKEFD